MPLVAACFPCLLGVWLRDAADEGGVGSPQDEAMLPQLFTEFQVNFEWNVRFGMGGGVAVEFDADEVCC